jgi:predicted ATPase/class 3 adenylate cyclase
MPTLPIGTVTFLFTDIEGSTNLARTLGPRWPGTLEEHHAILRHAIREYRGIDIRTEGDAFFAVFPSAVDAVGAVAEAQRSLSRHRWPPNGIVRVRMGLHTGEGRLGGGEYVGLDVHRAARIAAAAHGGQVLLSETTRALATDALPAGTTVRDLGPHRLKDFDEPQRIYQLAMNELASDFPPLKTLDTPTNLPPELTSFVGREEELERITELLQGTRLLTLTGPGGCGKTRLALRAAARLLDRFPDGVFFVELAAISEPGLVPGAIASAVGAREQGPRPIMEVLQIELRQRTMLMVLDNFEQVVQAAPAIPTLLAAAPGIRFVVTSRGPLHVRGEQEFPVPPLDLPDPARALPQPEDLLRSEAVALFVQRAAAVNPLFRLDQENAPDVVAICRRLDALPLAIELAASRIRLLSPASVLERLDRALPLLEARSRDLPARQRTLRGAIAWSYDILPATMATMFRRVSVFSGGFDLEAVSEVCEPMDDLGLDALGALETLLDASLVRRRAEELPRERFDMLQTVREFGMERLTEQGEWPELALRHARYFLDLLEATEGRYRGPELVRHLSLIWLEHDNIRSALSWALDNDDGDVALRMVSAVWRFWHLHGDLTEGRQWAERALALPSAARRSRARAAALVGVGSLAYWQLDVSRMFAAYQEALDIFQELEDPAGIAQGTYNMGFAQSLVGRVSEAADTFRTAHAMFEHLGDRRGVADSLFGLSIVSRLQGDIPGARAAAEDALRLHRELEDLFGIHGSLHVAGIAAAESGELDTSRAYFFQALQMAEDFHDLTGVALTIDNLADQEISRGHILRAMRLAGASERIKQGVGAQAPPELIHLPDPKERARPQASEDEIRAAWDEGRAMTIEQALAYAREAG